MRNLLIVFLVGVFFLTIGVISQEANASVKSSINYENSDVAQQIDVAKWSEGLRTKTLVSGKYLETAKAPVGDRRKRRRR